MRSLLSVLLTLAGALVARPAGATLITATSFHGGVVVASDLRATSLVDGGFTDGWHKVFITGRTLYSVTNVYTLPGASGDVVLSDQVARIVGDRALQLGDVPGVAVSLREALAIAAPDYAPTHAGDEIARVTFYDPAWIASLLLHSSTRGELLAEADAAMPVIDDAPLVEVTVGQGDYLRDVVRPLGFLSPTSESLSERPPFTRDFTRDAAVRFVRDIIESSSRAALSAHPPKWGIGGGVEIFITDAAGPRRVTSR